MVGMNASNHLSDVLSQWFPCRDNGDWVLATIYKTEGPCYRKAGAMMLFSSQGHQLGMLSGGCLESDIGLNAQKVMQSGQAKLLCYDGSDEDDMSFHLGIGCGGTIYIMLQQVSITNDYLQLIDVYKALNNRTSGYYYQKITTDKLNEKPYFTAKSITDIAQVAALIQSPLIEHNVDGEKHWLATPIVPEPHILVVGGGIDARPLVNIAKQLGWQVSLWDPRPANARKEYFTHADNIIKGDASELTTFVVEKGVNAAVLMSHNISIDAHALNALSKSPLRYVALLGPKNRKHQVVTQANIEEKLLPFIFVGPSGLDIGGTLPESIALSILSECHACLFKRNARPFS